MKRYKPFISILIFIVVGCNNKNNILVKYNNFPIEESIKLSQIVLSDTVFIRYPYKIAKTDSLFFILDIHPQEYYVQCYSYPNFEHICSLFKRGQGPEEYISINNIQCVNDTLFVFTINQIHFIDIKNINSHVMCVEKIKLSDDFGFLNNGVRIKDNFFFPIYNKVNDGRVMKFDNNGDFITSFGEIRIDSKQEIDAATYQAWIPFLDGNEKILVAATQFGEIIDIYSLTKNYNQLTIKGKGGEPSFQRHGPYGIPNGITGFENIHVTNNYIYAIYNGEKMKERQEGRQGGKYIHIYDYEGNPVKKIILDHYIMGIYIDEKDATVHALDVNNDEPLFKAKLH